MLAFKKVYNSGFSGRVKITLRKGKSQNALVCDLEEVSEF
jgi:hypothetical protein